MSFEGDENQNKSLDVTWSKDRPYALNWKYWYTRRDISLARNHEKSQKKELSESGKACDKLMIEVAATWVFFLFSLACLWL